MSILETIINVETVSLATNDIDSFIDDFNYINVFSKNIIKDAERPAILNTTNRDSNYEDFYLEEFNKRLEDYGIILTDIVTEAFSKSDKWYDEDYLKEIGVLLGKTLTSELGGITNGIGLSIGSSLSGIDIAIFYNEIINEAMGVGIKISTIGGTSTTDASEVLNLSYTYTTNSTASASKLLAQAKSIVDSL